MFFLPPGLYYREEYEYRIIIVILHYVTPNKAFENESYLFGGS